MLYFTCICTSHLIIVILLWTINIQQIRHTLSPVSDTYELNEQQLSNHICLSMITDEYLSYHSAVVICQNFEVRITNTAYYGRWGLFAILYQPLETWTRNFLLYSLSLNSSNQHLWSHKRQITSWLLNTPIPN